MDHKYLCWYCKDTGLDQVNNEDFRRPRPDRRCYNQFCAFGRGDMRPDEANGPESLRLFSLYERVYKAERGRDDNTRTALVASARAIERLEKVRGLENEIRAQREEIDSLTTNKMRLSYYDSLQNKRYEIQELKKKLKKALDHNKEIHLKLQKYETN